jgi:L-rhamnose mutarotase
MEKIKRYCIVIELKNKYIQKYIEIHLNPWQELLKALHDAGVNELLIWNYKNLSIVYYECEDINIIYKVLGKLEIVKEWNKIVEPWFDSHVTFDGTIDIKTCKKIFDLNQQLIGRLDKY